MSKRGQEFIKEVRALCIKHGIQIAVSGYDGINLYTLLPGDEPIYANGIDDLTLDSRVHRGCGRGLEEGQFFHYCGETDMGQTMPALCTECGGEFRLKDEQK